MKLLNSISVSFLFLILSCTNESVNDRHIGKWIATKHGLSDSIIFDSNKIITCYYHGNLMCGGAFTFKGKTLRSEYKIDYSKKPIWIDINYIDLTKNQVEEGEKCIMEFLSTDTMMIRIPWAKNSLRPDKFDLDSIYPETMIYFRRKE